MNTIKTRIRFAVAGQTLSFEAPQGRPAASPAPTVILYDPRHARTDAAKNPILASATATQGPSTTLDGAAGAAQSNPRNLPVAATTGIAVGDFFILTKATTLQAERVEVVEITATESVRVRYPLVFDYVSADAFASALLTSGAVPTAWASDEDNLGIDFEAVWSFTTGGIAYAVTQRWDLVREVPQFTPSDDLLLQRHPDLNRWARKSYSPASFAQFQAAAVRDVTALLRMLGFPNPALLRGNEVVQSLTERYVVKLIADDGGHPPGYETQREFREHAEREVEWFRTGLLEGTLKIPFDVGDDQILQASDYGVQPVILKR